MQNRKYKTTAARRRANRKWNNKHRIKARKIAYRSTARTYIRHYANRKDLVNLIKLAKIYLNNQ